MNRKNKIPNEMSIEEILKSIRGIINTHQKDKPKEDEDILELTEIVSHSKDMLTEDDSLISSLVANESISNIKNFAKKAKDAMIIEKKSTAEDLLIQLLRPQLKEWLDKNLPKLIEQMLEKEIKRLVHNEEDNRIG